MRSDPVRAALRDIARNINLAGDFIEGMTLAEFLGDFKAIYAVTRCLEIISEASRRLPEAVKARHASIAWRNIAGAGNVYRHDYEDVTAEQLWDTVRLALPALRAAVEQEIGPGVGGGDPLREA